MDFPPGTRWVIEMREGKAGVWLPPGHDRSGWIEVTKPGEEWASFFDPAAGFTHRCEDYRRAALVAKGLKA